ncbi:hypothetical protein MNEG_8168 [Monoraphidium neglectum]|uniref:Uncharacterized protein n=1 Tax=Monoraphidium neglectum TaxID=145388 RepID=A0A0D2M942_9CHLO|nr:hypothetical protein MNEG_8168 [Monoraphidium neglectum]KIY99794.1 hypothetical protein MNEG_8168 [Monoraphidium neglectum]|eukprot:XP_013898814.1 hypothetical protein MNEG_8168 [Monoraphidium neglectum]
MARALHGPVGAGAAQAPVPRAVPRRLTNDDLMDGMLTMMGGVDSDHCTGYAGGGPELRLVDEAINLRLWRDLGSGRVEQSNLYQAPAKLAGSGCTRFAPYLRADATRPGSIRPDGYGLRSWTFDRDSDLVSASAQSWVDGSSPIPPHRSMRVLTVPHAAAAIVNGALPPAFEAGKGDIWVLEFILAGSGEGIGRLGGLREGGVANEGWREPGAPGWRWATMNWYEDGALAVNRSINEDRIQLPSDLAAFAIDPAAIKLRMAPRRDSAAVVGAAGIDAYISRLAAATRDAGDRAGGCGTGQLLGSCWAFSWDEAMQLVWEERQGCVWEGVAGGPGPVIEQLYPDCSYCRQPIDLRALAEAGHPRVTFEAGTVLRDGAVGRWLLTYSLQVRLCGPARMGSA